MKRKYIILTVVSIIAVILDQVTKIWAKSLALKPPITVIDNFFHFVYVENRGAAWGILSNTDDAFRIPFFIGISLLAILFIVYFFRRIQDHQLVAVVALSCVLGGAIGNFIDRIAYNSVIDFIDWHYYQHHWPTFNIADVFISIGVGLLVIEMLFGKSELSLFRRPDNPEQKGRADLTGGD